MDPDSLSRARPVNEGIHPPFIGHLRTSAADPPETKNHWNGDPLITVEAALGMAQSMTYRAVPPQASLHEGGIKGTRLPVKIMKIVEKGLERMEGLRKWFVKILPEKAQEMIGNLGETLSDI